MPRRARTRFGEKSLGRVAALALLLLAGCAAPGRAQDPPVVHARPITLERERPDRRELGRLRYEAGFVLASADPRFGGLSGIWLSADGERMIAASDRGTLWSAELLHDGEDRLTGVEGWRAHDPGRLPGDPARGDAEALAGDGAGGLVVAYEGRHRLRRLPLDDPAGPPIDIPVPDALAARPGNTGIEALAGLTDSSLLALSEGLSAGGGDLLAWRIAADRIETLAYAPATGFAPTGAVRLDEAIYVIERRFSLLGGFAGRIVWLPAQRIAPGARLEGEELARLEPPVVTDNYEAIAARRAGDGRTLLYVLSDDNFHPLQRTLLLQFSVPAPSG